MNREDNLLLARHYMCDLAEQPLSLITHRPAAAHIFIDVTIEGQRFQGIRNGNTLYVSGPEGACALGVASINQAQRYEHFPSVWHICKYWHQAACPLTLTPAGLRMLAVTFGLPIVPQALEVTLGDLFEREHFYDSPAFAALHSWATKRPHRVAGAVGDSYLGLWPLAALEGRYVESNPSNVALAHLVAAAPRRQRGAT